ncbi:MAG: ISL3 family transposase [Deltaproteobacteria bacterium]|nr:ISL3 family transposase [Deltaproteobacteria bacterium]
MHLAEQMPVLPLSRELCIHPNSVWRILEHYVKQARQDLDLSKVVAAGIDECSKQKGHKYVTTFCDLERSRVLYVAEHRHAEVLQEFAQDFKDPKGNVEQIQQVCCDMWPAYISGVHEYLPNAANTFDHYHVMSMMNRAIDEVRCSKTKEQPELLKRSRYLWLKNPGNLSGAQTERIAYLKSLDLKTSRAYYIKLALQRLWSFQYPKVAERYLKKLYYWATHSRLEQVVVFAKTLKNHWDGVLNYTRSRITNGIVEGINSKIKTALKRAYGFKSFQYYRTIIYLVAGKPDLPTRSC